MSGLLQWCKFCKKLIIVSFFINFGKKLTMPEYFGKVFPILNVIEHQIIFSGLLTESSDR